MAQNEHGLENAVNIEYLDADFLNALSKAWCHNTCWNGCKDQYWSENPELTPHKDTLKTGSTNPSFGNCFVSTLAAWGARGFVDDIIPSLVVEPEGDPDNGAWHFFLEVNDGGTVVAVDPTRQQFRQGYHVEEARENHSRHNELLYYSIFEPEEARSVKARLNTLLKRMEKDGYKSSVSATQIIDRLHQKFGYAKSFTAVNAVDNKNPETLPDTPPKPGL